MPRPNKARLIGGERNLARRVSFEREKREWTYEGLASRMTAAGCAIQASALYKIEKADPPRRITVDELVALAKVFDTSVEDLLRPLGAVLSAEVAKMMQAAADAEQLLDRAIEALAAAEHLKLGIWSRVLGGEEKPLGKVVDDWFERESTAYLAKGVLDMSNRSDRFFNSFPLATEDDLKGATLLSALQTRIRATADLHRAIGVEAQVEILRSTTGGN